MSNTTIRILVAIIGIPCIVALCLLGGLWLWGMVAVLSAGALIELYRIFGAKGAKPFVIDGVIAGVILTVTFEIERLSEVFPAIRFLSLSQSQLMTAVFVLFTMWILVRGMFRTGGSRVLDGATTIAGVAYVPAFFGTLAGIRELFMQGRDFPRFAGIGSEIETLGGATIVSIFAVIWICDSAAYFGGRAMGRHKLFERISPKKTWEGAVWGLLGAVGAALGARALVLTYLTPVESIIMGIIIGVFGQLGDLAESALKRDAGVKDSSTIIPGHGGILDRFDSLLFVSPLLYGYFVFLVRYP